ncbi:hypothetical protein GQ53DRAFT_208008 [Thozetella sp. PMI_491]|nr:hypothetical protein GQ53DRAFT_208008 [Thozetella sp. PMI_491]
MPSFTRRHTTSQTSSRDSRSRRSDDSYDSKSTTPTSLQNSPRPSDLKNFRSYTSGPKFPQYGYQEQEVSPDSSLYPRSSVDTYASTTASEAELEAMELDDEPQDEFHSIPPLPAYHRELVEPNVRACSPQEFSKLFPSLNRLTIRHDEFTSDGNMNLRVDTVMTGRRRTAIQLFHLRMYDLAKREFSLRRYCRDSGREVCNSKRKYVEPTPPKAKSASRPILQRSMTSAIKTLGGRPVFQRTNSDRVNGDRPATGHSSCDGDDEFYDNISQLSLESMAAKPKSRRPLPTNTIKLEFSNYARVDIRRRGGGKNNKRYEFEWWGHRYTWKRTIDKQMGLVSFHLLRDGNTGAPVAHIAPEMRSPSQVLADENAGGWVPPCFMWIADEAVVDAVTDVADVIMATGLIALVDDCIKERWQTRKVHRVPLTSKTFEYVGPKAFMQQVFGRRNSEERPPHSSSPLRYANPISAY